MSNNTTYGQNKFYIPSLDSLFADFAIEPALPDPKTFESEYFEIATPAKDMPTIEGFEAFSPTRTYKVVLFRKTRIRNPATGKIFHCWVLCDD